MSKKDGLMRLKMEFENVPIIDTKQNIRNEADFDNMIGNLKRKFFGR